MSDHVFLKSPEPRTDEDTAQLAATVAGILREVQLDGDEALRRFSERFDDVRLEAIEVSTEEIETARQSCTPEMLDDANFAISQVRGFAQAQLESIGDLPEVELLPGVRLGHRLIPIRRIGAYVPGGRYPLLSSPIMAIVPAKVAGVEEICVCTPPRVHPAVLWIAHRAGADRIFRIGGAQAIAAMAYGTGTVPAVDKVVGPGNAFVNEAKRQVFGAVGIDQLAGPSEVFVIADETADPRLVAAEMLAQAEHDVNARAGLITLSRQIAEETLREVDAQLVELATAEVARTSWERNGEVVLCASEQDVVDYADYVGAEHLALHVANPQALAPMLRNYGSLFLGSNSSVVFSDKTSGTNHILPTDRAARYTGGLWVGTFLKVCTHQIVDADGARELAPRAARQSAAEGLDGHRRAAAMRIAGRA